MFTCSDCTYISQRKFNLQRHIRNKHHNNVMNTENEAEEEIVNQSKEKVNICQKCNKIYKTKKHLVSHEKYCKGIDELTCPRCMISFTKKQAKCRHIKANKCKARSIIHARMPNIQNITNNGTIQNAETIQNINNTNNIIINNIINNFGSERIDHITENDITRILQSGINTIPLYIQMKHFDENFPENRNIKYTNDNKCKVLEDNSWKEKDLLLLSMNLIKDNCAVLLMYCDENEIKLLNKMQDSERLEHIRNKLFIVYNQNDNNKYNQILSKIKDMIKNS